MAATKRWTPLALTILGFAGLGSLGIYRILQITSLAMKLIAALCAVLYVAWMLWESRVSVREISKPEADHDRGTMELCAAVKVLLLVAALGTPSMLTSDSYAVGFGLSGLALLIFGIKLRISAIRAMGDAYSHRIRTPTLPLTVSGPYANVRHPAYAGTLLIHAGVVCTFANVYSWAALAGWAVAVGIRTRVEDRWLMHFEEYRAYRDAVPSAWFPFQRLQSRIPVVLWATLLFFIAEFSARKLAVMEASLAIALGLVVVLYIAWLLGEGRIAVGETSKDKTRFDRGTCELYAFARAATVLTALDLPTLWGRLGLWYPIGLILFVGGVALRLTAIRVLGRFYSHRIRLAESHTIVSRGPYRILRHPAYTGMIAAHLGFVICFFNWISLAILLFGLVPAVVVRIRFEERALFELDGYPEYARMRRRLVPLLW